MSRDILVVKRGKLFNGSEFSGFCPISLTNYIPRILENLEYHERTEELENNSEMQQIIPYVWLINPKTKSVFLYVRSEDGDEGRLHNKLSGGVGGHIDRDTDEQAKNPIVAAMMRELKEEVSMFQYPEPKFIGFINDDSSPVGEVHFGVAAIAETEEEAEPAMNMKTGGFHTIKEAESLFSNPDYDVEPWTQITWPNVKMYLSSLP